MKYLALLFFSVSLYAQTRGITIVDPAASNLSFLDVVATKKMVALGESGHAVAEFHRWRGAMSRYLIEKHGFRQVFIEEDALAGFNIIEAMSSCKEEVVDYNKVNKAFGNFDTATYRHNEFFSFYQFVCEWNHKHPNDTVTLYGMDVWSNTWDVQKYLAPEIAKLPQESIKKQFAAATDQCFLWSLDNLANYPTHPDWVYYGKYQRVEPTRMSECMAALYGLNSELDKYKKEIVTQLGNFSWTKFVTLVDVAKVQQQIRDVYTFDFKEAMKIRDAAQARNTMKLLKYGGHAAPSIFMAHNLHTFKNTSAVLPKDLTTPYPWAFVPSAGEWLTSSYGDEFASIGVGGYDLHSYRDGAYPIPTSARSFDVKLNQENAPFLFVDVNELDFLKDLKWWMHNETEPEGMWVRPKDQVDYYFFIQHSEPATLWKYAPTVL